MAFDLSSSWSHGADRIWESIAPDLWRSSGNPWLVIQTASRDRLRDLWRTPEFRALVEQVRGDRNRGTETAVVVSDRTRRIATRFRGLLQPRIRALRGIASLLGRTGQCRGGLPQGRTRSRGADDRRRTPVPAGVLPSGDRRRRSAAGVLPFQRYPLPAGRPRAQRAWRMGARSPSEGRPTRLAARLGRSPGRRPALSSGLERPGEPATRPRHHGAALRRGPRGANPPGDGARDRRLAASSRARAIPQVSAT